MWATCNLGADYPEDSGCYFSWGDPTVKNDFSLKGYPYYIGKHRGMKNVHGKDVDVARKVLGVGWRLPTIIEMAELFANCDASYIERNGTKGLSLTSRINGNSVFLPACGSYNEDGLSSVNYQGNYWTASQCESDDMRAVSFFFNPGTMNCWNAGREVGLSVRPVMSLDWNDEEMYQPEVKLFPRSQYTFGLRKSSPLLVMLFYLILVIVFLISMVVLNSVAACFGLLFQGKGWLVIQCIPAGLVSCFIHKYFFNKDEIYNG